jgi:hypothetical protein
MKHHPICIPNTFNGILAWGYNCNTKAPAYDAKYQITDNLGMNFLEDTTASYTQFATLLGTRSLVEQRVKEVTHILRQLLEGEEQTLPVPGFGNLGPAGQYTVLGGLLSRYGRLRHYLVNHENYARTDGEDLGFYPLNPHPDETQLRSHVTWHRSDAETKLRCTKPGQTDAVGVEYDTGDDTGWHLLGVGTNSDWLHDFRSPPKPTTLTYRVRLYHRGHEIGLPAIIHLSSQP